MQVHHRRLGASWPLIVAAAVLFAADTAADAPRPGAAIERWLVLGPVAVPLPAYAEEGAKKIGVPELLEYRTQGSRTSCRRRDAR